MVLVSSGAVCTVVVKFAVVVTVHGFVVVVGFDVNVSRWNLSIE